LQQEGKVKDAVLAIKVLKFAIFDSSLLDPGTSSGYGRKEPLMGKNFALIGASGYVAPRHMKAIQETGNHLVAVTDPSDSVGIIDRFGYQVSYFPEFERFERHIERLNRGPEEDRVSYVSICSPNYLHDSHIRFALRVGADAICEKPLVLNPWNVDLLAELEKETGRRISTILQLRLHPEVRKLKSLIEGEKQNVKHTVTLDYLTPRGKWYAYSWKGDEKKSGGLATNIGIHLFDMLLWIFGSLKGYEVFQKTEAKISGHLSLEKADVTWNLSIDPQDLPDPADETGGKAYRRIMVDDQRLDFSGGFTDLHTEAYKEILSGNGFGLDDVRPSIELVSKLRNVKPTGPI